MLSLLDVAIIPSVPNLWIRAGARSAVKVNLFPQGFTTGCPRAKRIVSFPH